MCVKCGKTKRTFENQQAIAQSQFAVANRNNAHALITYVGSRSFTQFIGDVSRRTYRFEKNVTLIVDPRDVSGLMKLNKGGRLLFIQEEGFAVPLVIGDEDTMKAIEEESKHNIVNLDEPPVVEELTEEEVDLALDVAIENGVEVELATETKKTRNKKNKDNEDV